jgi:tetratricopeptide (TPR) repeat protein
MMKGLGSQVSGLVASVALAIAALGAGCGGSSEQGKEPVLTADPPLDEESGASKGGAVTEIERGVAYLEQKKFAEAKAHFEKALALDPKNPDAMFNLAAAKEGLGDRAGAEASYKGAIKADPKLTAAFENLGALYLSDEPPRADDAIKVLADGLATAPDNVRLMTNLAYAYSLKNDVEAASKRYDAVIAKGGDSPEVRLAYAELLLGAKQHEKAAEHLKKALAGAGDDAPTLVTVGRLLGFARAYGDCVKALNKAIAIKSDDPEWFVRRGTCRHELKDEPGARADYEAAIKVNPKFAPAHFYLGLSLLGDQNIAGARASLTKAAELGQGTNIEKLARKKLDEMPKK